MKILIWLLILYSIALSAYSMNEITTPDTNEVTNVYFLSGLGADERAFAKLKINQRFNVHFLQWIDSRKNESLHDYALRLVSQIDTTRPFQLVGLSFGGMIASEIAELVTPEQIILISSRATSQPLSKFYQNLIKITLWHPLAAPMLKTTNKFTYRFFGAHSDEEKKLLKQILADTDSKFLKWALGKISSWDHRKKAANVFQIHGTEDRLITPNMVHPDVWIEGGGHLMVYTQAEEVSEVLNKQLANVTITNCQHE
jgi:pimeloyl-ACP methyl ester carboxylesterase